MVQSGDTVKAKIEGRIFSQPPGSSIRITPKTRSENAGSYGYDGTSDADGAVIDTVGVPYGFLTGDRAYYSFGLNAEGETNVAVRESITVEEDDYLIFTGAGLPAYLSGVTFIVKSIKDYPYHDVNLARILTVKKIVE